MPDTNTPTLTRADVEALRDYLLSSRRPVAAILARCSLILGVENIVYVDMADVTAVLACLTAERWRWAREFAEPILLDDESFDAFERELANPRAPNEALVDLMRVRAAPRPISVTELKPGESDCVRPTVHVAEALPSPRHLEVGQGRNRAGEPEPAEALRRRIVALLTFDTLTAWQLKTAMQVPYQDVARALLTLEGRGVARRICDPGHPDLWSLVEPGN